MRKLKIIPILASGKNVISIIAGWNPKKRSCYPDILEACQTGKSSLYGTGLNPGLVSPLDLPLARMLKLGRLHDLV